MTSNSPANLESTYLRLRNDATVEKLTVDESSGSASPPANLGASITNTS